jgi:hypothetical protein
MEYALLALGIIAIGGYVLYRRNYNKNNPRPRPANPDGFTNTIDPAQYQKELDKLSGK